MIRIALALLVASPLVASCKRGTEPKAEVSDETRPGPERGSAGGFSASLSADLEVRGPTKGSGSDFFDVGSGSGSPETGSAGSAGSNSMNAGSNPAAGSNTATNAGSNTAANAGSNTANAGSNTAANAGSNTAGPAAKAGSNAGSAAVANAGSNAGSNAKPATGSAAKPEIEIIVPKPPIAMTAELKAIQLSLLPNWKRDTVEPATISLDVDVQSRDVKETFKFRYGYEDPKAPPDREAFKKYLADAKIMKVTTDRQRGAAWYLEGNDASGNMSFRLIVIYGGKRLYCGGSAYKTSDLGDIRDEVVVQAKKICETVSL